MKRSSIQQSHDSGFTVAEMSIGIGVLSLLGLVFFQVLQQGLILSAKNTAVNAAHEEARQGVLRLTRDIHASISVPQLRDTNRAVVSPTPVPGSTNPVAPTAAGVSFQNIASGPNYIWKDPGNSSMIMIRDNPKPEPGMRLIIPFWGIEDDIKQVTAHGTANHSNVFTVKSLESKVNKAPSFMNGRTYAIIYYTSRVMYLVENGRYVEDTKGDLVAASGGVYTSVTPGTGTHRYEDGELNLYKQSHNGSTLAWSKVATVARYISSPTPFSVPLNRSGSSNNKYIAVNLSARDPKSTNRGYIATASLLNTEIDYRSRLTVEQ